MTKMVHRGKERGEQRGIFALAFKKGERESSYFGVKVPCEQNRRNKGTTAHNSSTSTVQLLVVIKKRSEERFQLISLTSKG